MSKLKMPLPYLSHSAFALFNRDPMAYYEQYYVARYQEERAPMTLGKIFQLAWCDPKYDYAEALKKAGFTSDKARAIKTALEHPATIRLPKKLTEKSITIKGRGLEYPILAQLDGLDPEANLIVENKFGVPWTQERVNNGMYRDSEGVEHRDRQLTWYTLVYWIKYRKYPKFLLQSFNGKHGAPNKFWVKKYSVDLDMLIHDINSMVARVTAGDFEKYT
jgi:hypothetical protein